MLRLRFAVPLASSSREWRTRRHLSTEHIAMAYDDLTRRQLAALAPELMITGQSVDRPTIALVIMAFGQEAFARIAIEEWMGASPVYTARMREALNITGNGVSDIFKAVQFDVGAPPQLLDFQFYLESDTEGGFDNEYCGALIDIEPMGHDWVRLMCHDIQDPTFDATASATNPKARFRPIHRPPRVPEDRTPHCAWRVFIDADAEPLALPEESRAIFATQAATVALSAIDSTDEGVVDYSGQLFNNIDFTRWARSTLVRICEELAIEHHLLSLSFEQAVRRYSSAEKARELMYRGFVGVAAGSSARLARHLDAGDSAADVASVLALNPALGPVAYTGITVAVDADTVVVTVPGNSPARRDAGWISTLTADGVEPLSAAAAGVHPNWGLTHVVATSEGNLTVSITRSPEPLQEPLEMTLAKASKGLFHDLEQRPMLPVVSINGR